MMKDELRMMIIGTSIILLSLFIIQPVYAKEYGIDFSQINAASPVYFIKSFKESLELKLANYSKAKGLKYFEFAGNRIDEVKSLTYVKRPDLIPPALEKYWSSLSKVLGLVNINDQVTGPYLLDGVGGHIITLSQLQNQTDDKKARIAIRSAMNRISNWNKDFFEKLNTDEKGKLRAEITAYQLTICNFLSKEASSSALNQTEKFVLQERVKKCLQLNK